jgi:hypothetical protein
LIILPIRTDAADATRMCGASRVDISGSQLYLQFSLLHIPTIYLLSGEYWRTHALRKSKASSVAVNLTYSPKALSASSKGQSSHICVRLFVGESSRTFLCSEDLSGARQVNLGVPRGLQINLGSCIHPLDLMAVWRGVIVVNMLPRVSIRVAELNILEVTNTFSLYTGSSYYTYMAEFNLLI